MRGALVLTHSLYGCDHIWQLLHPLMLQIGQSLGTTNEQFRVAIGDIFCQLVVMTQHLGGFSHVTTVTGPGLPAGQFVPVKVE